MKPESKNQLVGIIGHPLGHTLSPAMHNAAFKELQIPFTFGTFDVTVELLAPLIAALRTINFVGASVTIPYKQDIIPLLDNVSDDANALGAVNTIVNNNGRLTGYNTDVVGITTTLDPFKKMIQNKPVLVLGAGGGARAVLYAISKNFTPGKVTLYNRTAERATAIIDEFQKKIPAFVVEQIRDAKHISAALEESALVVNTTSVGMSPNIDASPLPSPLTFSNQQIIFDIIYNPIETALLRRAKKDGARTINGVEMLVQQGAKAFELWTGKAFPVEIARSVVTKALSSKRT